MFVRLPRYPIHKLYHDAVPPPCLNDSTSTSATILLLPEVTLQCLGERPQLHGQHHPLAHSAVHFRLCHYVHQLHQVTATERGQEEEEKETDVYELIEECIPGVFVIFVALGHKPSSDRLTCIDICDQ